MDKKEIIKNIASRTGGDIYLGVVGAVRTGKSTFIKKVVENLIVPNIEEFKPYDDVKPDIEKAYFDYYVENDIPIPDELKYLL